MTHKIPTKTQFLSTGFKNVPVDTLAEEDRQCSICLSAYRSNSDDNSDSDDSSGGETAVRLEACGHVFGLECVKAWISGVNEQTCPLCRSPLFCPHPDTWAELMSLLNDPSDSAGQLPDVRNSLSEAMYRAPPRLENSSGVGASASRDERLFALDPRRETLPPAAMTALLLITARVRQAALEHSDARAAALPASPQALQLRIQHADLVRRVDALTAQQARLQWAARVAAEHGRSALGLASALRSVETLCAELDAELSQQQQQQEESDPCLLLRARAGELAALRLAEPLDCATAKTLITTVVRELERLLDWQGSQARLSSFEARLRAVEAEEAGHPDTTQDQTPLLTIHARAMWHNVMSLVYWISASIRNHADFRRNDDGLFAIATQQLVAWLRVHDSEVFSVDRLHTLLEKACLIDAFDSCCLRDAIRCLVRMLVGFRVLREVEVYGGVFYGDH